MDSSSFSGVIEGVSGRVVGYDFKHFALAIMEERHPWRRKR